MAKSKTVNVTVSDSGTQVIPDRVAECALEYEQRMLHPENLYKLSSSSFTGLIKYINKKLFGKPIDKCINTFHKSLDIYTNCDYISVIWDRYTELCYDYDQKPTIEEFCLMVGISRDTLYSWASGESAKGQDWCDRLSCTRTDMVHKWMSECKLGRYKGAAAGNVGYIFLCKAIDGLVETAPVHIEQQKPKLTAEQLPRLFPPDAESLPDTDTEAIKTISSDDT